jgi:chromosomal replication initiator protein
MITSKHLEVLPMSKIIAVCGSPESGKTTFALKLAHSLNNKGKKKVLYVSAEMFTNELINSINNKNVSQFKRKYRNIDVLLIDDIQFIEGKEATEEEFFHTFETLYNKNKQIVISSDRPPQKLTGLDERLRSRFLWNITADIQAPDFETRVAILKSKAEIENVEINDDVNQVIYMIAEKIKYNVRELEGAFTRIVSFSGIMNKPINMALAKSTLTDIVSASDMKVTITNIKSVVADHYGITIKDMDSAKRSRNLVVPRQIAMYLCKEMTDKSLPQIGKEFGGRDHTTVLHACKKISSNIMELQDTIDYLTKTISSS